MRNRNIRCTRTIPASLKALALGCFSFSPGGASGRWPNRSEREPRHFTNMNNRNTDKPGLNKKRRLARSLGLVLAALLLATTATAATTVTVQVAPNGDLSFSP